MTIAPLCQKPKTSIDRFTTVTLESTRHFGGPLSHKAHSSPVRHNGPRYIQREKHRDDGPRRPPAPAQIDILRELHGAPFSQNYRLSEARLLG